MPEILSKILGVIKIADPLSRTLFYLAILGLIIQAGLIAWSWGKLPPVVPLHFSLPWGEERLIEPRYLITLVVASGGVLLVNTVASRLIKDTGLVRILASSALVVSILAAITLAKIITVFLP